MAVYFLTELDNSLAGRLYVKIGRSKALKRRIADLQTGNRRTFALMGEIRTSSIEEDKRIEKDLHDRFSDKSDEREWFFLSAEDVIEGLKRHSVSAYISVGRDAFEIVSYDRDAVPEFVCPWLWGDVDVYDFCPSCGWACGWTYSENFGGDLCLECGASERDYDNPDPE